MAHTRWRGEPRICFAARRVRGLLRQLIQSPFLNNVFGLVVLFAALGWLSIHTQPMTAGSTPISLAESDTNANGLAAEEKSVEVTEDKPLPAMPADGVSQLAGREALLETDRLLKAAEARLEKLPAYSAKFLKQERLGDSLTALQVIRLRVMHKPFRIFMNWETGQDAGQRVVYAEGENDGDMLVHKLKGIESRLGVMRLKTDGFLALRDARQPVTRVGLLELVKSARQHRRKDLRSVDGVAATLRRDRQSNGRPCLNLTVEYETPDTAPDDKHEYRKTVLFIDEESKVPTSVWCYGWPQNIRKADRKHLDETTLLEFYAYQDLDLDAELHSADFTRVALQ